MDSILNKLTEIESAAVSIVQHAEAEKSILDEKYDEKRRQFDLELEAEMICKKRLLRSFHLKAMKVWHRSTHCKKNMKRIILCMHRRFSERSQRCSLWDICLNTAGS